MSNTVPLTPMRDRTPPTTPPLQVTKLRGGFAPLTPDSPVPRGKLRVIAPPRPLLIGPFPEELQVSTSPIGSGSFSCVYKAQGTQLYAIKVPKKGALIDTFENELRALTILNSPGNPQVIHFYGLHGENGLVLDYFDTDLLAAIPRVPQADIFEPVVGTRTWYEWASALASGLEYIHSKDIIHADLKPSNFLVNYSLDGQMQVPVIADFSSCIMDSSVSQVTSPVYSAPEVQGGAEPTQQSDIYALGVVLIYCATGVEPYSEAKNAIQRVMWQKSVSPLDACGDAGIRAEKFRNLLDKIIVDRSLEGIHGCC